MKIVVLIKQVPDTKTVKMDEVTGTVIRQASEAIINPLDLYAIEAALMLKESHGGTVTVISMGPTSAEFALREAVAMGADKGFLVSDKLYAGSDTWSTAFILASVIKLIGVFDLIICGERATDGDTGQVGPEIASSLNLPVATYVKKIEINKLSESLLERIVEDGTELLTMQLPGVITVVKEIGVPRLPTLRGKMRAKASEIKIYNQHLLHLNLENVGLKGSPTRVVKIFNPKIGRKCHVIPVQSAEQLDDAIEEFITYLKRH
jgi:electron transfer flavoprotein beta subunit